MSKTATQTFIRGTAIKITTILSVSNPDSVKITIDDPSDSEKVSSASMTNDASKVYSYVWQSATTNIEGDYVVTITVVSGAYTTIKQDKFTLTKQSGSE